MSVSFLESYHKKLLSFIDLKTLDTSTNSNDLVKKSKELILNTSRYDKYSNYYTMMTTIHSFKLPEITSYPIQINPELIPIQNNKIKEQINQKRKRIFMKCSRNYTDIIDNNHMKTEIGGFNDKEINEKTLMKYIDIFNNKNSIIHRYIDYKEKYFINDDKRNINTICEGSLTDENTKSNTFSIDNGRINIKLKYQSIKLLFFDFKEKKKISSLKLPFWCVSFIYRINYNIFKIFLSLVIEYNNERKQFIINENKFNTLFPLIINIESFDSEDSILRIINIKKVFQNEFDWIVLNKSKIKYRLKIILPQMIFSLFSYEAKVKIKFFKESDYNHTTYFTNNQFKDWDFYLLNSLCVYKKFRYIMNKALSFDTQYHNQRIIINLSKKIVNSNSSVNCFEFFITKTNNTNRFFILKAPLVKFIYDNKYTKIFNLSLKDIIQINLLHKYFTAEEILRKCICISSHYDSIINMNVIDNVDLNLSNTIYSLNPELLDLIPRRKKIIFNTVKKDSYFMMISQATIEWTDINITNTIELKKMIYKINDKKSIFLFGCLDIEQWGEYIYDFYDDIEHCSVEHNDNFILFEEVNMECEMNVASLKKKKSSKLKLKK